MIDRQQGTIMAERSFAREVQQLRLGAGLESRGEGILGIAKAALENDVGHVAGCQRAPASRLMNAFAGATTVVFFLEERAAA